MFIESLPRKAFYTCFYLSLISALLSTGWLDFLKNIKNNKGQLYLPAALLLLGVSKLIWSNIYSHDPNEDILNNYHQSGKMFIISSFVYLIFVKNSQFITRSTLIFSAAFLIILSLISVLFGYKEFHNGTLRIKMLADAATTTAYIIIMQAVIALYAVKHVIKNIKIRMALIFLLLISFSLLLIMTGTRSALIVYLIIMLVIFSSERKLLNKNYVIMFTIAVAVISGSMLYKNYSRIVDIKNDFVSLENKNDNTSIGARFTMLKAGLQVMKPTLFGQSVQQRLNDATAFITTTMPGSTLSLYSIKYHFHNEIIESLSLHGIFGGLTLLFFYISALASSIVIKENVNVCLLMLILSLILMGLTDVLMIQSNTSMIIGISIILASQVKFNAKI